MTATLENILASEDIETMVERLSSSNCRRCSLSQHKNRIVVYRGNLHAQIMMIGEAPGLVEDSLGKTFVGPAGIKCDQIFKSIGLDTDEDMYLSNICKCRPIAQQGTGKQNYTPVTEQREHCLPYIKKEIELINPQVIILAGRTAAISVLGLNQRTRMAIIAGTFIEQDGYLYFIMYHPAYIIHAQKAGPAAFKKARETMWEHAQILREKIEDLGITLNSLEYKCKFCNQTFYSSRPSTHQGSFVCPRCWDERLHITE